MIQSKKWSMIEVATGLIIGLTTGIFIFQPIIFKYMGLDFGVQTNTMIAVYFTAISFVRGYIVRRFFAWLMKTLHIKKLKREGN